MRSAALSSTELDGRGAGRGGSSSAVVIGRTLSGSAPAARRMSRTKPYQVVAPWLVTWKMPGTRAAASCRMAGARSAVKVGQPRWSSTKASSGRSRRPRTVFTMLGPWAPNTHAVRTTQEPGACTATACSPAHFDRP